MSKKAFHAQFRWPRGAGCELGRRCIDHLDQGFDDAEFWERWMDRLHPDERRAIANDEIGTIKRPLEPEWSVGIEMQVASNYWITPETPKFTHRGWRIHFTARDFRVRIPRQTPGMFEPPDLDAQGYPIDPTEAAIKQATELGNYTPADELAVPETDEAVPKDYDNVIQMRSRERAIDFKQTQRAEETRKKELRALTSSIKETAAVLAQQGLDTTPLTADLQRVLAQHQQRLDRAA